MPPRRASAEILISDPAVTAAAVLCEALAFFFMLLLLAVNSADGGGRMWKLRWREPKGLDFQVLACAGSSAAERLPLLLSRGPRSTGWTVSQSSTSPPRSRARICAS